VVAIVMGERCYRGGHQTEMDSRTIQLIKSNYDWWWAKPTELLFLLGVCVLVNLSRAGKGIVIKPPPPPQFFSLQNNNEVNLFCTDSFRAL
jgi:hypothetical protein